MRKEYFASILYEDMMVTLSSMYQCILNVDHDCALGKWSDAWNGAHIEMN